jgi:hypothetical protein
VSSSIHYPHYSIPTQPLIQSQDVSINQRLSTDSQCGRSRMWRSSSNRSCTSPVTSNSTHAIKMMRETDDSYQISCLLLICIGLLHYVMSLRNFSGTVERNSMFRRNIVMGICTFFLIFSPSFPIFPLLRLPFLFRL